MLGSAFKPDCFYFVRLQRNGALEPTAFLACFILCRGIFRRTPVSVLNESAAAAALKLLGRRGWWCCFCPIFSHVLCF